MASSKKPRMTVLQRNKAKLVPAIKREVEMKEKELQEAKFELGILKIAVDFFDMLR